MTEGNVDGLGGKTEKGCGKEPGGWGAVVHTKRQSPQEMRVVAREAPAGRLLQDQEQVWKDACGGQEGQ